MKWGIDLKQHGMSRPFLPSIPSSTPCLTRDKGGLLVHKDGTVLIPQQILLKSFKKRLSRLFYSMMNNLQD
ncbi:hypothetical protein TNCV_4878791 [Trichonephila clavipes]|nr:hypothetical protein TNCV_4878791 [Trichonephila clavipes]